MANKPFSRLIGIVTGKRGPGSEDPFTLEAGFSRVERFANFCALVARSFIRNRCLIRASALSYSTLLALIPMLAVAISVTSGLLKSEGEDRIYQFIDGFIASVMPPAVLETKTNAPSGDLTSDEPSYPADEQNPGAIESGSILPDANSTNAESETFEVSGTPPNELPTNAIASVVGTNAPAELEQSGTSTNVPASSVSDKQVVRAQKEAARYIHDFIQNTRSGTLGVTGMVLLVFVAIAMLSRVEETFNDIWGVERGRNWFVRIVQYWAVITLGPLLLAGALALSGGPHFQTTKDIIAEMPLIGGFIFKLLPVLVLWLTFALLYLLVPNTKVNFSAAVIGGVVAGTLWFVNNMVGFLYVSRVVSNSKIYGSLGLVPVFMFGLYLSWVFLLFGAQVAYAFQNRAAYLQEKLVENVNQRGREFVALRLMTCISQRYQRGMPPATITQISNELGVPSRLAQQVLQTLLAARLVIEVSRAVPAYVPGRPLDTINAHHILMAMRATVGQELFTRDEPVRAEVLGEFARIQEAEKLAASSVTMLALVSRAEARMQLTPPVPDDQDEKMVSGLSPGAAPVIDLKEHSASIKPKTKGPATGEKEAAHSQSDASLDKPTATSSADDLESFPL